MQVNECSGRTLAFLGDAVWSLAVRKYLLEKGEGKGGRLGWVWKDFLFMMVSICLYLFFVVIIKE